MTLTNTILALACAAGHAVATNHGLVSLLIHNIPPAKQTICD